MEWTIWIAFGAALGGLSVAAGAFGAHALKAQLTPENLNIFEVGARYQMYHALALLAVGLLAVKMDSSALKIAGVSFVVGTVLFSGSLYTLALTGTKQWGMVTPIGGVAYLVGWVSLVVAALGR